MLELVIFDMDGLMLDTEAIARRVWPTAFSPIPPAQCAEDFFACCGYNRDNTIALMEQRRPGHDIAAMFDRLTELIMTDALENGVPTKPGLHRLLDALEARGIPKALATSTDQADARRLLEQVGIWHRFDVRVFGDMVPHSKPDPAIFLLAAGQAGAAPERCMVLEDSFAGIRAAHRAGMLPVMVPDLFQPDEELSSLLFRKLDTLDQAIPLLDRL